MGKKTTIEDIKTKFPLVHGNLVFNLLNDDKLTLNKRGNAYYCMLSIIDNEGYKYYISNIKLFKHNGKLNRFFYNNLYTYDNIRNFIKRENLRLELVKEGELTNYSREKLEFIDLETNKTIFVSWNNIQHFTYMYKYGYDKEKEKNKEKYHGLTKSEIVELIYKMQDEKGKLLSQGDFESKNSYGIGIKAIYKFWGNMKNMQRELCLDSPQYKHRLTDEQTIIELLDICNSIKIRENRIIVTKNDIESRGTYISCEPYENSCKRIYNKTLREFLYDNGYILQTPGNGMHYLFDDGEKTISSYEYLFSSILRENNLEYNKDYFRNIKYKLIDDTYSGEMDCDYKLNLNGKIVYFELAGILEHKSHIDAYKNNYPITNSKSKEKYRLHLISKKQILEKNNLTYHILFPYEINKINLQKILSLYI